MADPTPVTTVTTENSDTDTEVVEISPGFAGVLQIIANKISKKAAVIGLAMVLIYLLSASPATPQLVFSVIILSILSIFYSVLQWILDRKQQKTKLKVISRTNIIEKNKEP